jgi:hypothetical protein
MKSSQQDLFHHLVEFGPAALGTAQDIPLMIRQPFGPFFQV